MRSIILLLVAQILLISCSSEDENRSVQEYSMQDGRRISCYADSLLIIPSDSFTVNRVGTPPSSYERDSLTGCFRTETHAYWARVQSLMFAICISSLKFSDATIELAAAFGSTKRASSAGIPASVISV